MINDAVIKEIYKKYGKKKRKNVDLRLDYFAELLSDHHKIEVKDNELVITDLDEYNPFRRLLIRSINAIIEFDKNVAIVLHSHIVFLRKDSDDINVHIRLEEKDSVFHRFFG